MNVTQQVDFAQACHQATSLRQLPLAEYAVQGLGADPRLHIQDPVLTVAEFDDCLVNRYGFVMLKDGTFITDIGYRHNVERSVAAFDNIVDTETVLSIDEPVILANGHNNYYHWHLNWLPRIVLADRFSDLRGIKVLVHEKPAAYALDALQAVTGRQREDCLELNRGVFRVKKLFVPTPFPNPMHAPFAVRCYNGIRQYGPLSTQRKLYLTRGDAPSRRILNEHAVIDVLSNYGFETVQPETLSYLEQVSLFSEAGMIVGAHGAGLTNMLFCQPGFSAVELFNGYYSRVYWSLAATMGVKHYKNLQSNQVETPEGGGSAANRLKNSHFHVDLTKLQQVIEECNN